MEPFPRDKKKTSQTAGMESSDITRQGISGGYDYSWLEEDPMNGEPMVRLSLSKFVGVLIYIATISIVILLCNLEKTAVTSSKWWIYVGGSMFLLRLIASIFVYRKSDSCWIKLKLTRAVKQYFMFLFQRMCLRQGDGSAQESAIESRITFSPSASNSTAPIFYLANIKAVITILVVAAHSGFAIGGFIMGGYRNSFSVIFNYLLFIFGPIAMPFFFFISAYFVPESLVRKKRRVFLNDKSIRLTIVLALGYFIIEPSWLYFAQRTFYPDVWQPYFTYKLRFGEVWFLYLDLLFIFAYVIVSDSWPCYSASAEVDAQLVNADDVNGDREIEEHSSEIDDINGGRDIDSLLKRLPVVKAIVVGTISGVFESVRMTTASSFPPSVGNLTWYILFFIGGLIARRDGWLDGADILTPKERITLAVINVGVVLLALTMLLVDLHQGWNIIVPFSNQCDDAVVGHANPTNRFVNISLRSTMFLYTIILYAILGAYSVTASLYILDVAKRRFNYTNKVLRFIWNSAYGVYITHFPLVIGYTNIWLYIVKTRGTVGELTFSAEGVSATCLGSDGFLWLAYFLIFSTTIVTVFPAIYLIKKLPIMRNII